MTLLTMQIEVPFAKYDNLCYFLPREMSIWLHNRGLKASLAHTHSSGNGYTNGVINALAVYRVSGVEDPGEAIMFKLRFPECNVAVRKWGEK